MCTPTYTNLRPSTKLRIGKEKMQEKNHGWEKLSSTEEHAGKKKLCTFFASLKRFDLGIIFNSGSKGSNGFADYGSRE